MLLRRSWARSESRHGTTRPELAILHGLPAVLETCPPWRRRRAGRAHLCVADHGPGVWGDQTVSLTRMGLYRVLDVHVDGNGNGRSFALNPRSDAAKPGFHVPPVVP